MLRRFLRCPPLSLFFALHARLRKHYVSLLVRAGNVTASYEHALSLLQKRSDDSKNHSSSTWRAKQLLAHAATRANNHFNAMFHLAKLLHNGKHGVKKDVHRALYWYQRAVDECGHTQSMAYIAYILANGGTTGVPENLPRAVELYSVAAARGDVKAKYELAHLLKENCEGVERDVPRATALFEETLRASYRNSAYYLARLYNKGHHGLRKDIPRAMQLYERAIADNGDIRAMVHLSCLLRANSDGPGEDLDRANGYLQRAAEGGNIRAMNILGSYLFDGDWGFGKDHARAMGLLEQAVTDGYVKAMENLAMLLWYSDEVPRDEERAVQLVEQAAGSGHVSASLKLSEFLLEGGDRVPQDAERACKLLGDVIDKTGDAKAMVKLAFVVGLGDGGIERDGVKAVELFRAAIASGRKCAKHKLREFLNLEEGRGIAENIFRVRSTRRCDCKGIV